jgi:DNA-binding CsgD family transcriptional regulator
MPKPTVHDKFLNEYLIYMMARDILTPPEKQSIQNLIEQTDLDISMLLAILLTRYPNGRHRVPKAGNLHIAWDYAENPADHHRFIHLLRVTPPIFNTILNLIEDHPIFTNNSNNAQAPVESQLAVTLYRMGRYGNSASVEEVARIAGCSEGSVENYTHRCFTAIEALHSLFVRRLSPAEKEVEKEWIDEQVGFRGTWREGWIMYDGTIVVLYKKPGLNGDAYYTRKGNYGLNAQVGYICKL